MEALPQCNLGKNGWTMATWQLIRATKEHGRVEGGWDEENDEDDDEGMSEVPWRRRTRVQDEPQWRTVAVSHGTRDQTRDLRVHSTRWGTVD